MKRSGETSREGGSGTPGLQSRSSGVLCPRGSSGVLLSYTESGISEAEQGRCCVEWRNILLHFSQP